MGLHTDENDTPEIPAEVRQAAMAVVQKFHGIAEDSAKNMTKTLTGKENATLDTPIAVDGTNPEITKIADGRKEITGHDIADSVMERFADANPTVGAAVKVLAGANVQHAQQSGDVTMDEVRAATASVAKGKGTETSAASR